VYVSPLLTCENFRSLAYSIVSRLLLNLRKVTPPQNSTLPFSRTVVSPEWSFPTGISSDLISAVIGNIGADFEEADYEEADFEEGSSPSIRPWSMSSQATTHEYPVSESIEDSESGIEMIQVSDLIQERERVIGWDQLWAAGING
jgi:hypothetical protein